MLTTKDYDLANALTTYGGVGVDAVLEQLLSNSGASPVTPYRKKVLLGSLEPLVGQMEDKQLSRLGEALAAIDAEEKYPSLAATVSRLKELRAKKLEQMDGSR